MQLARMESIRKACDAAQNCSQVLTLTLEWLQELTDS